MIWHYYGSKKKVSHLKKVQDVIKFVRGKSTNIFSKNRITDIVKYTFDYDILNGLNRHFDDFLLPAAIDLEFVITKELYDEQNVLLIFTEELVKVLLKHILDWVLNQFGEEFSKITTN